MDKKCDAIAFSQRASRVETGNSGCLRHRKGVKPQKIGCPLHVDAIDIRLPKRLEPFTRWEIDEFTVAARLRTFKLIFGIVSAMLLLSVIHKCMLYQDLYVQDIRMHRMPGVGIEVAVFVILSVAWFSLRKFGHRLTLRHTECIAMCAYVLALSVYLHQSVRFSNTLQAEFSKFKDSHSIFVEECVGRHELNIDNPGTINGCYGYWFANMQTYATYMYYHEMMAFAVSCCLVVLMPLNPAFVFVCQNILTWTLVTYWAFWRLPDLPLPSLMVLNLLPRMLLSLACTGFAMHQQRYLSIIMKEDELIKQALNADSKNLSSLNHFWGTESSEQTFGYHDMENSLSHPANVAQDHVVEDFASGALNQAQSVTCKSPQDFEWILIH